MNAIVTVPIVPLVRSASLPTPYPTQTRRRRSLLLLSLMVYKKEVVAGMFPFGFNLY